MMRQRMYGAEYQLQDDAKLDAKDKAGRNAATWAEDPFAKGGLSIQPSRRQIESIALFE